MVSVHKSIMKIIIKIEDNKVEIILRKNAEISDRIGFDLENNLTEKLLPTIDKIVKRNKLEPKDIEKVEFDSKVPDSYTTFRIAKAVADAYNWGLLQTQKR